MSCVSMRGDPFLFQVGPKTCLACCSKIVAQKCKRYNNITESLYHSDNNTVHRQPCSMGCTLATTMVA